MPNTLLFSPYSHTSGTPAFGQDINGSYTIINIATTIVILSYYSPLNFEFCLLGGLTFNVKVASQEMPNRHHHDLLVLPLASTSAPELAAFTALAADAKSTGNFVLPGDITTARR